jgi:hypothetical protein
VRIGVKPRGPGEARGDSARWAVATLARATPSWVGPARYCSPRHRHAFCTEPSALDLDGILRRGGHKHNLSGSGVGRVPVPAVAARGKLRGRVVQDDSITNRVESAMVSALETII